MNLEHTFNGDRREQATDARGIPSSFQRAMTALKGTCLFCDRRAEVADGSGSGYCRMHHKTHPQAPARGSIAEREQLRRELNQAKAWKP